MLQIDLVKSVYYDLSTLCSALGDLNDLQLGQDGDKPSPVNILLVIHGRFEELLERYELDVLNPLKASLGGEGGAM